MNADDRERVRKIVDQDGWNIIWIGAKMPCEFLDEEVELLYEDMDGQPCICYAIKEDKHMNTEMTVAFIVLAVWSAVFTAAYIGERYRNRKLRNALKKKRSRYIREVSYGNETIHL